MNFYSDREDWEVETVSIFLEFYTDWYTFKEKLFPETELEIQAFKIRWNDSGVLSLFRRFRIWRFISFLLKDKFE